MSHHTNSLAALAVQALETPGSLQKAHLSREIARAWLSGEIGDVGQAVPPEEPGRDARPVLVPPTQVPRRKITADPEGRIALLHALAHIELHAINLCWDIIARFSAVEMPRAFYDDWVSIADDEARHHILLCERLGQLGAAYGDLPAHDGLWEAASVTNHNLKARLAIVPMVLEARGLDVTPGMIEKLTKVGDSESAARLQIIYDEEITHVAKGKRWFQYLCEQDGEEPVATWQSIVLELFRGKVRSPFNVEGRDLADFPIDYYGPIADL